MSRGKRRCTATTIRGTRCTSPAVKGTKYCRRKLHAKLGQQIDMFDQPNESGDRVHSALQYLLFEAPQSQINAILEVRKGLKR